MPLSVTPGHEWSPGEVVTPTKLNDTGGGTVLDGQSFAFESGAAATPPISFQSDTNTGIYNPSSDALGVALGGNETARFTTTGLGSGTQAPASKLHAHDASAAAVAVQVTNSVSGSTTNDGLKVGLTAAGEGVIDLQENQPLTIRVNGSDRIKILANGRVGIANGTPTEQLDVTGNIKSSGSIIGSVGTLGSMGCRAVTITTGAPSGGSDGDVHIQYVA